MKRKMNRREFIKSAASGAAAGTAAMFLSGCTNRGKKAALGVGHRNIGGLVRGRVVSGGKPLGAVRCSDGRQVVLTDREGRFAIDSAGGSGPFVFVVTPGGYWTDRFYVPMAKALKHEVLFELEATGPADKYSTAYVADIHLGDGNKPVSYECFAATVDELNTLPNRPAFLIAGGDISLQLHQGDRYVEMMSRLKMPVRNGFGNHEMMTDQPKPKQRFTELFGPTYHSFDYGSVHYVVMDGCLFAPQNEGYKNVVGHVGPTEMAWLENDLKLVPKDMPTVAAIHIPLVSTYPERRSAKAEDVPWWITNNAEDVIKVLDKFNVPLVLQGHMHENERIFRGSTEFVESVSVSGSWWRTKPGRELAVSGEPRGYRIIDVDGTKISHRYMSSAELHVDEPGEFINVENDRVAAGGELVVNFFDASNEAKVFGRTDDGPWTPWSPAKAIGPFVKDLIAAHHWKCPEHLLRSGRHRIEVRCEDRDRADTMLARLLMIG